MPDLEIIARSEYCSIVKVGEGVFLLQKDPDFARNMQRLQMGAANIFLELSVGLYDYLKRECQLERFDDSEEGSPYDLGCSLQEIIDNAETHGNHFDPNKKTMIKYSFKEFKNHGAIQIKVIDEGEGFDFEDLIGADARRGTKSYNEFRTNIPQHSAGYGLFEVIRYCDSVR